MKTKKQFAKNFLSAMYFLAPALALAQGTGSGTIGGILVIVRQIIEAFIPIIFGLAFIVFLWGMYKYISAADEGGKEEGRNLIIYGIIGLFVMVAVWGLVKVIDETFQIDENETFQQPGFPGDTL